MLGLLCVMCCVSVALTLAPSLSHQGWQPPLDECECECEYRPKLTPNTYRAQHTTGMFPGHVRGYILQLALDVGGGEATMKCGA